MATHVLGLGVDTLCVRDFERLLDSEEFGRRAFTAAELTQRGGADRGRRLAACFAAKEAVLKAIGTGWTDGIAFTDVEVRNAPSGAPSVVLTGGALVAARERGIVSWLVSLSHGGDYATAAAIALGEPPLQTRAQPSSGSGS